MIRQAPPVARPPSRASLATIFIEKVVRAANSDVVAGYSTSFLYRRVDGRVLQITNWHALTGRRPEDPGTLLPGYGQSPYKIRARFATAEPGAFLPSLEIDLYRNGEPIWIEYKREDGIDLAAIPIEIPEHAAGICIQDFAPAGARALEPGLDVIVIGYPFGHGDHMPYPVWKRAMVATEPTFHAMGTRQVLLDTAGNPGMSGAPVFASAPGFKASRQTAEAMAAYDQGEIDELALFDCLSPSELQDATVVLSFVGVYTGATGSRQLEEMKLGRMFTARLVELMITEGQPGRNPFPPE